MGRYTVARPERSDEPHHIAELFINEQFIENGKRVIHRYQTQFWLHTGTYYKQVDEDSLRDRFHLHFSNEVHKTATRIRSMGLENAAWHAFTRRIGLEADRRLPCWLNEPPRATSDVNYIAFANGILSLPDMTVQPHTPEWFSPTALPFNYDPEARCDNWQVFLEGVFEDDEERMALLQEWFGYCLTPDTSRHAFLLLEGPPRSGKGTCGHIQRKLLGTENTSSVRLERFGDKFQLAHTVGKLLNVIDETDGVRYFDEGAFKSFVAGERMLFDVKNKPGFEADPTARVLMLCNERPPIFDRSGGTFGRMHILPFRKSYLGKENTRLRSILESELSGIFNWALEGRRRLHAQDDFTKPTISKREREAYELESNPARMFLHENVIPDAQGQIAKRALYETYRLWTKDRGFQPLNDSNFAREVRRHFRNGVGDARPILCGKRVYVWTGIRHECEEGPGANV